MKYWLTTHWPPLVDEKNRFSNTGAWVPDKKQAVLDEMQPGDMLFIYEAKSGRTIVKRTADGKLHRIPRKPGQQGVVALAKITTAPANLVGSLPDTYADGSQIWWRCKADGRVINSKGFIHRRDLARILGYSEQYPFRGFGNQNSGVKRLSLGEYEAIHSAFLASQNDIKRILRRSRSTGGHGGGEGPTHKSLKEYIAAHPEEALKEGGLRTVEVEYPFATGDRIDVLLEDVDGRPVTVEVEVDCDRTEVAGPLQCMKYRALIAYLCGWRVSEVRTLLAARSIASVVEKRCREYEVEVVRIPAWPAT